MFDGGFLRYLFENVPVINYDLINEVPNSIFFILGMIKTFFDLNVYQLGDSYSMRIFWLTRSFPKEERYSLTSQIIYSSRSICANIAEGWGRKLYENEFKKFLIYAMGSAQETKSCLKFAHQCNYINDEDFNQLMEEADVIGSKLFKLHQN